MDTDRIGCPQRSQSGFVVFTGLLIAAFSPVLIRLVRFAIGSDLESYIPLIPFISIYLLLAKQGDGRGGLKQVPFFGKWLGAKGGRGSCDSLNRSEGNTEITCPASGHRWVAILVWLVSGGLLMGGCRVSLETCGLTGRALFLPVLSFVTALGGGVIFFFGFSTLRRSLFPLLFLYFMVPIPESVAHGLRIALQQGSAGTAHALFWLTGTPVFRDGLTFCLPGLTIQIAEECSGIHSSLVLLITSLVAGYLFLRNAWSRTLLALVVIPLGLLRNGIRVVTLSLLTIHVDHRIIDGPLHHRGGPVFFMISMGVLVAILWGLRITERRRRA